jgi:large subunit ribosomal protein L9
VTVADVVAAVKAAGGPILDKRKVELEAPIKTIGTHQVVVRVQGDISAKVALEVTAAS